MMSLAVPLPGTGQETVSEPVSKSCESGSVTVAVGSTTIAGAPSITVIGPPGSVMTGGSSTAKTDRGRVTAALVSPSPSETTKRTTLYTGKGGLGGGLCGVPGSGSSDTFR